MDILKLFSKFSNIPIYIKILKIVEIFIKGSLRYFHNINSGIGSLNKQFVRVLVLLFKIS